MKNKEILEIILQNTQKILELLKERDIEIPEDTLLREYLLGKGE